MAKEHPENELVVVFKKTVTEQQASDLIKSWNVKAREGMDSSRGKLYFYATGDKYILTFDNYDALMDFRGRHYQFLTEVHEIYYADWDKQKD